MQWTIAQAAAWYCTRDLSTVSNIGALDRAEQLPHLVGIFREGERLIRRARIGAEDSIIQSHVAPKSPYSIQAALAALEEALLAGDLHASSADLDGRILPSDFRRLQLRIPDLPGVSSGLWDPREDRFVCLELEVGPENCQKMWPEDAPPKIRNENTILHRLLELTRDSRIRRADARQLLVVEGRCSARGFDAAWKLLPEDRKYRRGERGKGKKLPG